MIFIRFFGWSAPLLALSTQNPSIVYINPAGFISCRACTFLLVYRRPRAYGLLTLVAGYMFSRAWHWLHVFPRLALVTCFPRLLSVTCFPTLVTGYVFSCAWHLLHAWHRLCFPTFVAGETFPTLVAVFLGLISGDGYALVIGQ